LRFGLGCRSACRPGDCHVRPWHGRRIPIHVQPQPPAGDDQFSRLFPGRGPTPGHGLSAEPDVRSLLVEHLVAAVTELHVHLLVTLAAERHVVAGRRADRQERLVDPTLRPLGGRGIDDHESGWHEISILGTRDFSG
jgi:hypothetical protein